MTNMDNLVTKEYLDARFREQDARIEARFVQQDARIDAHFARQDSQLEARFVQQDSRFNKLESDMLVLKWMLALVVAAVVVPALSGLVG